MSKEIFIAVLNDRHCDTEAYAFSTAELAIEWAKQSAMAYKHIDDDLDEELTKPMKDGGWIYYACYSCEGDCVYVYPAVIDSRVGDV